MPSNNATQKLLTQIRREVGEVRYRRKGKAFNPFSSLVENICQVRIHVVESLPNNGKEIIRIALVSMPQLDFKWRSFSSLRASKGPAGVEATAYLRKLVSFQDNSPQQMLTAFHSALATAIHDFGANVICVSELGFPSRNLVPTGAAKKLARQLASEHGVLIIGGSAHDCRTLYNTGYAFYPGCPAAGRTFHKALSAVSAGELVCAPSHREILVINAFGLRIAVLICLDIADYASLGSLLRVADRVDLLLVPCYTEKFEKMVEIAKVASRALPGVVALVNTDLPRAVAAPYHIARFGELEKAKDTASLDSGAILSLVELDYEEFQSRRTQLKTTPEDWIEWLFGNRDSPLIFA
jgi:hypothetical protein